MMLDIFTGASMPPPPTPTPDAALLWARPNRLKPPAVPSPLAHLVPREQVLLYSLVFAYAPERCLEVGVKNGGGSRIIHAALSDLSRGRLIGLDPAPELKLDWNDLADRATLLIGLSPDDLPRAVDAAGGLFDFVFLDGDHCPAGVERDLEGLAAATSPGAMILCHDAHYHGVIAGIAAAISRGLPFDDLGLLARAPNPLEDPATDPDTPPTTSIWGGMRLLSRRAPVPDPPPPSGWRSRLVRMLESPASHR